MDTKTALDLKKSMVLFQEELGIPFKDFISLINFYNKKSFNKLKEASKIWNKFEESDIEERAKMLGLNYTFKKIT